MALKGRVMTIDKLTIQDKQEMYSLMDSHYDNVKKENFDCDLLEKNWILLLRDELKIIRGFSTIMILDLEIDGIMVKGIFSGDTIIDQDYWGETELLKKWGQFVMDIASRYQGDEVYWLLLSKGYKTYRFLPIYFKEFYPRYKQETPEFEKKLIDKYGEYKYPKGYCSKTGLIYNQGDNYYLKAEIDQIPKSKLKNPHVKFFLDKNSGYNKGNELVCVAKLTDDNLKKTAKWLLR